MKPETVYQHADFPQIRLTANDVRCLEEYPHYFCNFLVAKKLFDSDNDLMVELSELCDDVFYDIDDEEDRTVINGKKKEIVDLILGNFELSLLVHRFAED